MLEFSFIETTYPIKPPPRAPNGGLYTGETAYGNWGNVPVEPETHILAENLLSANPPPNAHKQPMSYERPGNNYIIHPYHTQPRSDLNIKCISK